MDYMTAAEASQKWGVSLRQVQRLLAGGRIPGAGKYARSWMIPGDAEKPADPRRSKNGTTPSLSEELARVIAATTLPMPVDDPDAILCAMEDRRLRLQYEGELAYLRGDFEGAIRCFHETGPDDAAKLRACPVAVAAAISMGDYPLYTHLDAYLRSFLPSGGDRSVSAFAGLSLATAAVSVIAPHMAPEWLQKGEFGALPVQALPDALYLRAKYFQCLGDYPVMLAVAQTALTLSAPGQGITMPGIYLRLLCAIACHSLERPDEARDWLLEAMGLCLPHGFITPFAESLTALGGLIERCLEQSFPGHYDAVMGQWERTWKNWVTFHNQFAKDNITLILSLREYHLAVQVARHVPYAKIARQYCISVGRLKNIMMDIYGKLLVSGRDELSKYIF